MRFVHLRGYLLSRTAFHVVGSQLTLVSLSEVPVPIPQKIMTVLISLLLQLVVEQLSSGMTLGKH